MSLCALALCGNHKRSVGISIEQLGSIWRTTFTTSATSLQLWIEPPWLIDKPHFVLISYRRKRSRNALKQSPILVLLQNSLCESSSISQSKDMDLIAAM